jgi:hypothetical protein
MASRSNDEAYALAYEEGRHAVSVQQTVVDNLRGRAGVLLSGAAIATSFLGGQALAEGRPSEWSWVAIASFALLGAATLTILWPTTWEFEADPRDIIATYAEVEEPRGLAVIQRDLALHRSGVLAENGRRLDRLVRAFRLASLLLLIEIAAWGIDLAVRVN